MGLADISLTQVLDVWSELEQCYHGQNGYGGTVAEIYAFRLMPRMPHVEAQAAASVTGRGELREAQVCLQAAAANAADALVWLAEHFAIKRDCRVLFESGPRKFQYSPHEWRRMIGDNFDHRVHVAVEQNS